MNIRPVRFVYEDGTMKAYIIGPKGGLREVDYHEAWLAVSVGQATEEQPNDCPVIERMEPA